MGTAEGTMANDASDVKALLQMAELIAAVTAAGNAATRAASDADVPLETQTYLAEFSNRLAQDEAELVVQLATIARHLFRPGDLTTNSAP